MCFKFLLHRGQGATTLPCVYGVVLYVLCREIKSGRKRIFRCGEETRLRRRQGCDERLQHVVWGVKIPCFCGVRTPQRRQRNPLYPPHAHIRSHIEQVCNHFSFTNTHNTYIYTHIGANSFDIRVKNCDSSLLTRGSAFLCGGPYEPTFLRRKKDICALSLH